MILFKIVGLWLEGGGEEGEGVLILMSTMNNCPTGFFDFVPVLLTGCSTACFYVSITVIFIRGWCFNHNNILLYPAGGGGGVAGGAARQPAGQPAAWPPPCPPRAAPCRTLRRV